MDFDFIERVVHLVEKSEIGELEVESGEGLRVVVKKVSSAAPAPMAAPQYYAAAPAPAPNHAASAPSAPEEIIDDTVDIIKAPMVGTFYRSPAPDAPPFVEEGNVVQKSHVVCILE
ncbi:hypothetical protein K8I31_02995, partial [bacterium]|nr:hypothetical protein [bacterium]